MAKRAKWRDQVGWSWKVEQRKPKKGSKMYGLTIVFGCRFFQNRMVKTKLQIIILVFLLLFFFRMFMKKIFLGSGLLVKSDFFRQQSTQQSFEDCFRQIFLRYLTSCFLVKSIIDDRMFFHPSARFGDFFTSAGSASWKYLVRLDDGRLLDIRWRNLLLISAMNAVPEMG